MGHRRAHHARVPGWSAGGGARRRRHMAGRASGRGRRPHRHRPPGRAVMGPTFRLYDAARDEAILRDLLCNERWDHRVKVVMTEADVREELEKGIYTNDDVLTFLIEVD